MYGNTWVGTGYVRNTLTSGVFEPHHVWFGREQDRPSANHTIYVNKNSTTWQLGSAANPYRTVGAGNFATVPGDTVVIQAGSYSGAVTLNRASTLTPQGGVVIIGQ